MSAVKTSQAAVRHYYETLERLRDQRLDNEGNLRGAFERLLLATVPRGWSWATERGETVQGRRVVPDGTLLDDYYQPRGHWEAKDPHDNLNAEVAAKIKRHYPLDNIIFEDTREAVLYQGGTKTARYDLGDARQLCNLLDDFYSFVLPKIENFEKAVEEFKGSVARLGAGLQKKVAEAHRDNPTFERAFERFFELCKNSLNPNLSRDAVDEMLIQHLLTERLLRTVFAHEDFRRRNVIAAEVEKVIDALVSQAFNRHEYLKSLDRFYVAIEGAAEGIADWETKQKFLDTVYERFFLGYSVKIADTHGIIYTPQPLVDFICASVERVLADEFGKALGDEEVVVIDPAAGTGSFVVNLLRRVDPRKRDDFYRHRLFANEVLLLPYYVCSLNVEHAYYELAGRYEPFEGMCLVDTLGLMDEPQQKLAYMTETNAARVLRQLEAPITVVIGNPPYNAKQLNENDNNKNRRYPAVEKRVRETYAAASTATNKNALADVYVKFFRWATDRLDGRDGVVCFVSNNGFFDGIAFDGFRKDLEDNFAAIYHFDFKGNARTSGERRRREGGNIFLDKIRVGVGITVLVKKKGAGKTRIFYHAVDDYFKEHEKTAHLCSFADVSTVKWRRLKPDARHTWLTPAGADEFDTFVPLGTKETKRESVKPEGVLFGLYGRGVATCRDAVVYDYDATRLKERVKEFIEAYNVNVDRYKRAEKPTAKEDLRRFIDNFVDYSRVKWSRDLKLDLKRGYYAEFKKEKIRLSLYRPFNKRFLFFDRILNEEVYLFPSFLPTPAQESENLVICMSGLGMQKSFYCIATNVIPEVQVIYNTQCFPFYVYDEDGTNRRENVTDWALEHFRSHYKDESITKWDVFHYAYGLLHHPKYRKDFAGCLKRDLARVPLAPDFRAFARAGAELAALHVGYEDLEPLEMEFAWAPDKRASFRVEDKMRWQGSGKTTLRVNDALTLNGIPKEAHKYMLGNRSALDWLVNQYVVKRDKHSHEITSDPNRSDDPEYIVRLVGQVARVSVDTVRFVDGLPKKGW